MGYHASRELCIRDIDWKVVVAILKCKVCGASVDPSVDLRGSRCTQCGSGVSGSPLARPGVSTGSEADAPGASRRDWWLRIYCRTLLVLLLYVLSTGPMYWTIYEAFHDNGSTFLAKLYFPIVLACQLSDTISNWFEWYIGLWVY